MSALTPEAHESAAPDYPRIFGRFLAGAPTDFAVVNLRAWPPLRRFSLARELDKAGDVDIVIVVIDTSAHSPVRRLRALLGRGRSVDAIGREFEACGFRAEGSFSLYPSAHKVSLVYERGTSASRYAEAVMLPPSSSAPARILRSALSRTALGSPSVDLVAIVGRKR